MIIDPQLVDLLEGYGTAAWEGEAWRHVFEGRDPLAPSYAGGRWAPPELFAVLYTSLARAGAIAEGAYLIAQYGIPPSRRRRICALAVRLTKIVDLTRPGRLPQLGVDRAQFAHAPGACPTIGAAANLLGIQGILAPNARFDCINLIVLTERLDGDCNVELVSDEPLPAP